jgi:hypothetical protein
MRMTNEEAYNLKIGDVIYRIDPHEDFRYEINEVVVIGRVDYPKRGTYFYFHIPEINENLTDIYINDVENRFFKTVNKALEYVSNIIDTRIQELEERKQELINRYDKNGNRIRT